MSHLLLHRRRGPHFFCSRYLKFQTGFPTALDNTARLSLAKKV
ncbi:hypothetical protein EMIT0196P_40083 [Pseudomonas chlororaphis]